MLPTTHGLREIEERLQVKPPMQLPVAGHACEQTPRRSGVVLAPSSVGGHRDPRKSGATVRCRRRGVLTRRGRGRRDYFLGLGF
jgi:hypothetical protein